MDINSIYSACKLFQIKTSQLQNPYDQTLALLKDALNTYRANEKEIQKSPMFKGFSDQISKSIGRMNKIINFMSSAQVGTKMEVQGTIGMVNEIIDDVSMVPSMKPFVDKLSTLIRYLEELHIPTMIKK